MADEFKDLGFEQDDEFSDLGFEADPIDEQIPEVPSQSQAALEGITRGATFGLSDEIAGGFEAGGQALGLKGVGGPITDIGLTEKGPTMDLEALRDAYVTGREAQRGREAASAEAHPGTALTSDIVGGFVGPAAAVKAGGALVKGAPKLEGLLSQFKNLSNVKKGAAVGAGTGALEGIGRSEADIGSEEFAQDVLVGTGLGGALGGAAGKVADKLSKKGLTATKETLEEEANREAMRSLGAGSSDFESEIEALHKFGKSKETGKFALDEGIVDPFSRPEEAYKATIAKKNQISQGYQNELAKFDDAVNLSEGQATSIADDAFRKMDEKIVDELGANDLITKEMREGLDNNRAKLQQEIETALQGSNPIRELQDLYVRYNKDFFSNAKNQSPTAGARKILRNEIKSMQRQLAETLDPESAVNFSKLDDSYTKLLDLEEITKKAAGKAETTKVGIGDIIQGATARALGVPVLGETMVAGSVAAKKLLKKDLGSVAAGASSIRKAKKAKGIEGILEGYEGSLQKQVSESPAAVAAGLVTQGSAGVDTQQNSTDYRNVTSRVEKASPEELDQEAQTIRSTYGKSGEQLAATLDNMKDKDRMGRKASIFKLLQDPSYRKMLNRESGEE